MMSVGGAWEAIRRFDIEAARSFGQVALRSDSVEAQMEGHLALAFVHTIENRMEEAVSELRDAQYAASGLHISTDSKVLYMYGFVYRELGEFGLSVDALERAMQIAVAAGDRLERAVIGSALGLTLYRMGCQKEAIEFWTNVEPELKAIGEPEEYANLLGQLGFAHYERNDFEKSCQFYIEAEQIALEQRKEGLALHFRAGQAQSWLEQGRPLDALPILQRAVQHAEASMLVRFEARWLARLGKCYLLLGYQSSGIECLLRSAKIYNSLRQFAHVRDLFRLITSYFESRGDTVAAATYYKMYMEDDVSFMRPSQRVLDIALRALNQSRQKALSQIPMF